MIFVKNLVGFKDFRKSLKACQDFNQQHKQKCTTSNIFTRFSRIPKIIEILLGFQKFQEFTDFLPASTGKNWGAHFLGAFSAAMEALPAKS